MSMRFLQPLIGVLLMVGSILFIKLMAHILSYCFGAGWSITEDGIYVIIIFLGLFLGVMVNIWAWEKDK